MVQYLKYFAKYEGKEKPFMEVNNLLEGLGAIEITRQPSIKTIGFYVKKNNEEEVVKKIESLDWIIEVTCHGPVPK